MSNPIQIFGETLQTPRAMRPEHPWPVPRPRPQFTQLLATCMLVTLLASSLGVMYYLDSDEDGPYFGPADDPADIIAPLLAERQMSSANLRGYDSCAVMEEDLRENIREEMLVDVGTSRYSYWRWGDDDVFLGGDLEENAMDGGAPQAGGGEKRVEGEDYSGTNNQEQGVDEADFVKTDGYYIYMINGRKLEILGVPEFGQLNHESTTDLEGSPTQMLMANDWLVVFSSVYGYNLPEGPLRDLLVRDDEQYWWRTTTLTKVTVIDVTDRTTPQVARELYMEGWYKTAREVEGTVRMVTYGYLDTYDLYYSPYSFMPERYWELEEDELDRAWNESIAATIAHNEEVIAGYTLDELVPQIYERLPDGNLHIHKYTANECSDFVIAEDGMSRGFTSIFTLDLYGDAFGYEADHIMSNWAEVYASTDTLLIAERAQDWWWFWRNDAYEEATNIHSFNIKEPGVTTYVGSGRVKGTVLDQFSLSEYQGFLRIATTSGQWNRWWLDAEEQTGPENHIWVLAPAQHETQEGEGYLAQMSHLSGIAIGERIWSSRFVGEKAYLVTFRNIDPLWTIDLSNPLKPEIKGELEVPGVSTYIHPMGDEHLLTIGIGPNAEGDNLDWRITQVSQFDVTDFSDPQLMNALPLTPVVDDGTKEWSWSNSEATYEHKAFQYWAPKALLAIPLSTYHYYYDYDDERGYYRYHYEYVSKLMLINAVPGENLTVYGEVDQSGLYDDTDRLWEYSWGYNIRRSIFMGDYIYAIGAGGVTVHDLDTLELQVALPLDPGYEDRYYYLEGDEAEEDEKD